MSTEQLGQNQPLLTLKAHANVSLLHASGTARAETKGARMMAKSAGKVSKDFLDYRESIPTATFIIEVVDTVPQARTIISHTNEATT